MLRENIWIVPAITVLMGFFTSAMGSVYFVATDGSDENPGAEEKPFRTIQKAADRMVAGDSCFVREGIYRETVELKTSGAEGAPIRFTAYPGEVVTISGAEPIAGEWSVYKGKIYKTAVEKEFSQLFVDGEMMVEARWPNAGLAELWGEKGWAKAGPGSRYGKMVDPALARTGIDWTGAVATLNVAHQFYTWTRPVRSHVKGSDTFEYDKDLEGITHFADKTKPWEDDLYYLSGKLEALDAPTEWFLDRENRTLYLWAPDGKNPASHQVEARMRDFAFLADGVKYVEVSRFHLFGASFSFDQCRHCVVDNCHVRFPTYPDGPGKGKSKPGPRVAGSHNVVRNCSIAYSATSGLIAQGSDNLVENNLIHDVCWNGSLFYVGIRLGPYGKDREGASGVARRNTVFNTGGPCIQIGGTPGIVEYNHTHHGGLASKDVSLIYTGGPEIAGSEFRYNWVHDAPAWDGKGKGIRGDDQTRALHIHHNVVWNCGGVGIIDKGDDNKVCNNTCFDNGDIGIMIPAEAEPVKPWRKQHPLLEKQNLHSITVNNCAPLIAGRKADVPVPGECSSNYQGKNPGLTDPRRLDFRPRSGSPLIDAGKVVEGISDTYEGKAPDIGAYEYGGEHWVPGCRNGLWVFGEREGDSIELKIALAMPPLGPITVNGAGKKLNFTPENWMRPQTVKLSTKEGPVAFAADRLGEARPIDLSKLDPLWGAMSPFEKIETGEK